MIPPKFLLKRKRLSEILRDLILEETGLLFSAEKLAVESWEEVDGGLEIGLDLRFENVTLRRLEEELEEDEDFDDELDVEPLVPCGALDHKGRP